MNKKIYEMFLLKDKEEGTGLGSEKDDLALMDEVIGDKDEEELDEKDGKKKPVKKEKDEEDLIEDDDLLDSDESEEEEEEGKGKKKDEEDEDDELDLEDNNRAVDFKKIKEKFPEFAKTEFYKEIRNAYYREGKYTELFPTIEEAQEAAENNETFNKINREVLEGGTLEGLLKSVKEAKPAALEAISSSFLGQIEKLDPKLYVQAITPVVKKLARQMYAEGKKLLSRDKDSDDAKHLIGTARNVMQWAFDDPDLVDKADDEVKKVDTSKEDELSKREQALVARDFNNALGVTKTNLDRHLEKAILDGLDPDDKLTDFVKDSLVERIKKDLEKQISSDKTHLSRMQSLWKTAKENEYDKKSLSRIVSAYLERARPIIPRLRSHYKARALGRAKNEEKPDDEKNLRIVKKGQSGRAPERDGKVKLSSVDSKKIDYSQTSDDDLMSGKVKLRG